MTDTWSEEEEVRGIRLVGKDPHSADRSRAAAGPPSLPCRGESPASVLRAARAQGQ